MIGSFHGGISPMVEDRWIDGLLIDFESHIAEGWPENNDHVPEMIEQINASVRVMPESIFIGKFI